MNNPPIILLAVIYLITCHLEMVNCLLFCFIIIIMPLNMHYYLKTWKTCCFFMKILNIISYIFYSSIKIKYSILIYTHTHHELR